MWTLQEGILIYAQFKPTYEALAETLQNINKNIVVAKIDASVNDVKGISIKGFPTVKLFAKKGKTAPVEYEGDRSLLDLLKFLQQNTR